MRPIKLVVSCKFLWEFQVRQVPNSVELVSFNIAKRTIHSSTPIAMYTTHIISSKNHNIKVNTIFEKYSSFLSMQFWIIPSFTSFQLWVNESSKFKVLRGFDLRLFVLYNFSSFLKQVTATKKHKCLRLYVLSRNTNSCFFFQF